MYDADVQAPATVPQVEAAHAELESGESQVCQEAAAPPASTEQDGGDVSEGPPLAAGVEQRPGSVLDADWSVTFEQVLATLLTEPPLVDYFERKRDIQSKVEACKAQRAIERQRSSTSDHELSQQPH